MMNQEVKAKWVTALRSGKYTQDKRMLKSRSNGYCCLGVLCEVSKIETGYGLDENKTDTQDEVIGSTIMKWAGLDDRYGNVVTIDGKDNYLSGHNDDGKTFLQIANAIEEQL